ncbi:MAG: ester cyclase [Dermatophilaceae bacterium]
MTTPKRLVLEFVEQVRGGVDLDRAHLLLAPTVLAHQVISEAEQTVPRTPQEYVEHVQEMQQTYGAFAVEVLECLAEDDKVYVRWCQTGRHIGAAEGLPPTGQPVREVTSAVYRVRDGRIVEYWLQKDRAGVRAQLEQQV